MLEFLEKDLKGALDAAFKRFLLYNFLSFRVSQQIGEVVQLQFFVEIEGICLYLMQQNTPWETDKVIPKFCLLHVDC